MLHPLTPHAEILDVAKEILAAKGVALKIVEFTDYVQPNNVVDSGDIDANYFQHLPCVEDFNDQNGTNVVFRSSNSRGTDGLIRR